MVQAPHTQVLPLRLMDPRQLQKWRLPQEAQLELPFLPLLLHKKHSSRALLNA
jgi:hypothetical protein